MDGSACETKTSSENARAGFTLEQIDALRRNPPHILNERELAIYLDISQRNARALRQRRAIPHVRLGGRVLYRLAEVNKAFEPGNQSRVKGDSHEHTPKTVPRYRDTE